MIIITLSDGSQTATLQALEVPLTTIPVEGAVDVITLDNNISTYFTANKRLWEHTWAYMSEENFNILKGFYDRQWTSFQYPNLSISDIDVSDIPVRMTLSPQKIVDHCGTVEDVTVTFRESKQI